MDEITNLIRDNIDGDVDYNPDELKYLLEDRLKNYHSESIARDDEISRLLGQVQEKLPFEYSRFYFKYQFSKIHRTCCNLRSLLFSKTTSIFGND